MTNLVFNFNLNFKYYAAMIAVALNGMLPHLEAIAKIITIKVRGRRITIILAG